jgi:hypothetical protein
MTRGGGFEELISLTHCCLGWGCRIEARTQGRALAVGSTFQVWKLKKEVGPCGQSTKGGQVSWPRV